MNINELSNLILVLQIIISAFNMSGLWYALLACSQAKIHLWDNLVCEVWAEENSAESAKNNTIVSQIHSLCIR